MAPSLQSLLPIPLPVAQPSSLTDEPTDSRELRDTSMSRQPELNIDDPLILR